MDIAQQRMASTYEILGCTITDMSKHVFDLTHKLLFANGDGDFSFDDAIAHQQVYSVRGMCGAIAVAHNSHLGDALSIDALCARCPYTAVSMYLTPSLCKLDGKVVYGRPLMIGRSNTRKSKLVDRAREICGSALKDKMKEKGLHFKWILAPAKNIPKPVRASPKKGNGRQGVGKGSKNQPDPVGVGSPPEDVEPAGAIDGDASMVSAASYKMVCGDAELAWMFVNTRVTFEGLIDSANEQAVSLEHGLCPRIFYASEEASLTMSLPGQQSKAGTLSFEEFILFSDGAASKVAASLKRTMLDGKIGGLLMLQPAQIPAVFG